MFQMNGTRLRNQIKERLMIKGVQFLEIHRELLSKIQHQESSIERRCSMGNQQSEFRNSIDPFTAFGCENRQFFIHELGLADRAPHARTGGSVPIPAHFLAGVTTPALHKCAFGKNAPVDFEKSVSCNHALAELSITLL